jgi:hypothetical protein
MPSLTIDERNKLTRVNPFQASEAGLGGLTWMHNTFRDLMSSPEGRERLRQAFVSYPGETLKGAWNAATGPGRAWAGEMVPGSKDELQTALRLGGLLGGTPAEVALSHPHVTHPRVGEYGAKMEKTDYVDAATAGPAEEEQASPHVPAGMEHLAELFT